jgi:two-component system, NarL family, invasion response regulator UvrY
MIKVLLVDDHSLVRDGLVKILKEENDIEVIGEADGYQQAFMLMKSTRPDIVILDISMPGKDGLELLKELRHSYPQVRVLMLSMHPEDRFAVRAIKAGAVGYLTKDSASTALVTAIREVYDRGKYITPSLTELLLSSFDNTESRPEHENLSDRELQVLSMIARGFKIKEIADQLALSPATIATYRVRVLEKMNLKSNVDLANYALRHNLID